MAINEQNLIPNSERSPEQLKKQTTKGGIQSGKTRRKKKLVSQIMADFLIKKYSVELDGKVEKMSGQEMIFRSIQKIVCRGDAASVAIIKEIREATEGSILQLNGDLKHCIKVEIVDHDA